MLKLRQIVIGAMAPIMLVTPSGHAAEIVWASAGGGTWTTTGNWVGGVVPTSTDTVAFKGWAPLVRTSWTVAASHGANASNMKDGSRATTWSSGLNQDDNPIQYVTINLGSAQTFGGIQMQSTISTEYPREFDVYVSNDGTNWGTAIASGTGSASTVSVSFSDQTFQHIKIQLTAVAANHWQMAELFVFGTAGGTQFATGSMTASASSEVGGAASNVLDFNNGTVWSPGANQVNGQYIQLDLGADRTFDAISMDAYSRTGDYPDAYKVEVAASATPSTWTQVATGTPTVAWLHVTFSSQSKRYIKITQTGSAGNWWSIYELRVYGTPTTATTTADLTAAGIKQTNAVTFAQGSGDVITVNGNWTQSAGTFTGHTGTAAMEITGDLNLTGGTFTSTRGTMYVGGAFNNIAGAFVHNSGQVMLNGTGSETFATDGDSFHDLTINDGLVAYWPFDESSSPAANAAGYSNDATWAGSTTSSTSTLPNAPALNFTNSRSLSVPGNNSYASFAAPELDAITIAVWVRSTSTGDSAYPRIVEMPGYALSFARGVPAIEIPNSVSWTVYTNAANYSWRSPTGTIGDGAWYHIVATFNGTSTATIYINGVSQTPGVYEAGSGTNDPNTGTGYIGNIGTGVTRDWNGHFDDFRIYNRVLSAAEVRDLFSAQQRTTSVATHTLGDPLVVANNLKLASGTLDVSSAACSGSCGVTVGGSWYNYGGTFTKQTGTVTFNGSGGNILSDRTAFYNLAVTSAHTWTLLDRLDVDNTLTISANGNIATSTSYPIHAGTLTKTNGDITGGGAVVLDATGDKSLTVNSLTAPLRIESPRDNGLVGYWKLDEGRGTVAYDLSGNGNNGTLTNSPIWSTDVSSSIPIDDAGSVDFNGTSQYVSIGDPAVLDFTGQITMAAWVKPTSSSGTQNILAHGHGTSPNGEVILRIASGVYDTGSWNGTTYGTSYAVPGGDLGNWVHLAGVYDGTHWRLYRNGTEVSSAVKAVGSVTVAENWAIGARGNGSERWFDGKVDDVRIYNRGLSANEVAALYSYGYTTGSTVVYSLGATSAVSGTLKIDSGILDAVSFQNSITGATTINGGTYKIGTNSTGQTFTGGLNVNRYGQLWLTGASGKAVLGSDATFNMDGTLYATQTTASIESAGTYNFRVGSVSGATPTLNITGLQIKKTKADGMFINYNTGSSSTFTRFDNVAFSNGAGTGAGIYNLQIYATSLYLASNGCTFDNGVTATVNKNVRLAGNGTSGGETRAIFGGATCASNHGSCEAYDLDDDSDTNGIGDDILTDNNDGAIIQWIDAAHADTTGSIEGFPTAAFDWDNFAYYNTYVAYHDTSGTADTVYVRTATGAARYSWSTSSGEEIIGTPRWDSEGPSMARKHYVYVATTGGKVYRLLDNGSTLTPDTVSPWNGGANNPFDCGCTITTPLAQDTSNLYWGGNASGHKLWTLSKTSASPRMPVGSPLATTATTSNTAPAIWTSGSTYAFLGLAGRVTKINTSTQALSDDNTNPGGSNAVTGRISVLFNRVYAGDDNGYLWSLDPANFAGTAKFWGYKDSTNHGSCGGVCQVKGHYHDPAFGRTYFGDQDGHIYTVNFSGTQVLAPWRPGTSSDAFATSPLYMSGILVAGTTTGTLYIIDANSNGTVPALLQTYKFGSSNAVSGVGFDPITSRYMVSTANATTKDGKLYYFAKVTDLTGF